MTQIKNTSLNKQKTELVTDIVGKKALDNRGKEVGTIKHVHIDPVNLTVEGISIKNGLFKEKDYIGKGYISYLSSEGAILSQTPLTEYIGMKVVDSAGKDIGKVKAVYRARKTNSVYSLTINRGVLKDDLIVTDKLIGNVGDKIMLNEQVSV